MLLWRRIFGFSKLVPQSEWVAYKRTAYGFSCRDPLPPSRARWPACAPTGTCCRRRAFARTPAPPLACARGHAYPHARWAFNRSLTPPLPRACEYMIYNTINNINPARTRASTPPGPELRPACAPAHGTPDLQPYNDTWRPCCPTDNKAPASPGLYELALAPPPYGSRRQPLRGGGRGPGTSTPYPKEKRDDNKKAADSGIVPAASGSNWHALRPCLRCYDLVNHTCYNNNSTSAEKTQTRSINHMRAPLLALSA